MLKLPPLTPARFARRFAAAERGGTAVEFALISLPFVMLLFGILEIAMLLLMSIALQTATETAARQIRTGEFQLSGANTKANFQALVCAGMNWMTSDCSKLYVDVRTFSSFGSLAGNAPFAPTSFNPASTCFSTGQPTDIVLVRSYYQWNLFAPFLGLALENMGGGSGKRLLNAATAFRNEPWNDNAPVGAAC